MVRSDQVSKRARVVKRAIDIVVSLLGLILLAPLLVIIAVLVKLTSRGPVLYPSQRMGLGGKSFTMYKFRSMYVDSPVLRNEDGSMRVEKKDKRVTPVGRVLRLGFDELPQLFNVLKGDMSLIGPRPDPPEALPHYHDRDHYRLRVRPGITGLAQVAGRTDIAWRERVQYDLHYLDHQSLWLDLKIALATTIEFVPPLRERYLEANMFARYVSPSGQAAGLDADQESRTDPADGHHPADRNHPAGVADA
ncbi:MAG: sugar transferase [Anaerolineae bacterium]|nr:sugar transferase [Anaerolineae bacterium]